MSWLFCYINHIINVANYTVTPRCLGLIFAAVALQASLSLPYSTACEPIPARVAGRAAGQYQCGLQADAFCLLSPGKPGQAKHGTAFDQLAVFAVLAAVAQ